MANNRNTYQQQHTVSVPKLDLLESVVYNENLSKKDLRVYLTLLTELSGWSEPRTGRQDDPMNYTSINEKRIADKLNLKKKDVEKSIQALRDAGILERGNSTNSTKGYRFTF